VINSIRAHLADSGIVAPVGRKGVTELLHIVCRHERQAGILRLPLGLPCRARYSTAQYQEADFGVRSDDHGWHRSNQRASAFITFPGSVRCCDRPGREWLLTPTTSDQDVLLGLDRARSQTALKWGQERLGSISKQGDRYLRGLFVAGALAVIRYARSMATGIALAHGVVRASPHQGRSHRACQQDCADGLGQ